jgi:hypothetical protein
MRLLVTCVVLHKARRAIINDGGFDTLGAATKFERGAATEAANAASAECVCGCMYECVNGVCERAVAYRCLSAAKYAPYMSHLPHAQSVSVNEVK